MQRDLVLWPPVHGLQGQPRLAQPRQEGQGPGHQEGGGPTIQVSGCDELKKCSDS